MPDAAADGAANAPGVSCGKLECRRFDDPRAAFRYILDRTDPAVLAVGEAHAQRGTDGIPPAVHRFSRQLLPELKGRATDLVVELMLPPSGCDEQAEVVGERQKEVTEQQRAGTQNEYVALGHRARKLGITPEALRPSCEDLERIAGSEDAAIIDMLSLITNLTEQEVLRRAKRNGDAADTGMVVAYGGAMHNDLSPRPGREPFSFGPAVSRQVDGYVALDLIVPEFIKDTQAWRSLPWYSLFDPAAHPDQATVYRVEPRSYVLIFPAHRGD